MKITTALLEKYDAGECNDAERAAVEQWLESPDMVHEHQSQHIADAWYSVKQQIKQDKGRGRFFTIGMAAAIALCLLSFGAYHYLGPVSFLSSGRMDKTIGYTDYRVPVGKKASLTLNDGSVVSLNSGSELRYPAAFDGKERVVYLKGEGLFTIADDPDQPFRVITSHTVTEVLGTVFDLKAYETETMTTLTVLEGKVRFQGSGANGGRVLMANEQASWNAEGLTAKQRVDAGATAAWKNHELVFDDLPVMEAVTLMERWYGIKIILQRQDLGSKRISASYRDPSLQELMKSLAFSLKFRYTMKGNKVMIQ